MIMEGACWSLGGADVSISCHALPFDYSPGSVFVQECGLDYVESVVTNTPSNVSSAESDVGAYCGFHRRLGTVDKRKYVASSCYTKAICGTTCGQRSRRATLPWFSCI